MSTSVVAANQPVASTNQSVSSTSQSASSQNPVQTETNPGEIQKAETWLKSTSFTLFGYNVPWWVVIIVGIVVLYYLYENGYLASIVGKPSKQTVITLPQAGGSSLVSRGVETPAEVRKLFGY